VDCSLAAVVSLAPVVRKKVEVRREQMLDAAVRQVQARGLAATRVVDVAAELDVSPALVFYHFDTKERLIAAAFAHAAERDLDRLARARDRAKTPVRRLRAVLRLYSPTGKASSWSLWIDGWAMALRDPQLRSVLRRLDARWKEAFAEVIAEGVDEGAFDCADPVAAAGRITAFLDGLAVQVVVRGSGLTRSTMQDWMYRMAAAEVGLSPDRLT
jgi:AcrR family transcriptional regulator